MGQVALHKVKDIWVHLDGLKYIFVKINNGCSHFVESADWAQATVDLFLPLGKITFILI